jgi:hypothetical protein
MRSERSAVFGRSFIKKCLPDLTALSLALLLLAVTWRRWTHPIVDHGREANIPLRLLSGERLYVDVLYYYGPLAPYFDALLFRVFGAYLAVLHATGIACAATILLIVRNLARRLLSAWESALATAVVSVTCATSMFLGNYIQPYSYAALYAWTSAFVALVFSIRYLETGSDKALAVAGVCAAVATLNKPEVLLLSSAPAVIAIGLQGKAWRTMCRSVGWFALPLMAIALPVYAALFYFIPFKFLIADTERAFRQPQMIYFARLLAGTLQWPLTGWAALAATGEILTTAGIASLIAALALPPREQIGRGDMRKSAAIVLVGLACWGTRSFSYAIVDFNPLRSAPFVLVAIIGWILFQRLRSGPRAPISYREQLLLLLAVFGAISSARVLFNVSLVSAYTPFTVPPLVLIIIVLLLEIFPSILLSNRTACSIARNLTVVVIVVLLLQQILVNIVIATKAKTFELSGRGARVMTTPELGGPLSQAVAFIEARTDAASDLVVLPQISFLNFVTRRRNPLREEIIVPGFLTPDRELEAIRRIASRRVEFVLISNWQTPEYLDKTFGLDYNQSLHAWIEEHYHRIADFGPAGSLNDPGSPMFFIRAYERNP